MQTLISDKKYKITRKEKYDFEGESYSKSYPNLHRYPATMIPQIGIEILKELNINAKSLLDPYCGSGSSFIAGYNEQIPFMKGFDLNPLAVLISKAKFTKLDLKELEYYYSNIVTAITNAQFEINDICDLKTPNITNVEYWFSQNVLKKLIIIKSMIDKIDNIQIKNFFLVPFSETIRESSLSRNGEFKLFRIPKDKIDTFNPNPYDIFLTKIALIITNYKKYYYPLLNNNIKTEIELNSFTFKDEKFDIVLTSPPYGDSKTTVAYGQFSTFINEWLGIEYARKIDSILMGGKTKKELYKNSIITDYIEDIYNISPKRAFEVSSFYYDLEDSINEVSKSINNNGYAVYIVGNRNVKGINLPTDQFIVECFEKNGFKHKITYNRKLGNKTMPLQNSPTNMKGILSNTMSDEYIIITKKSK